MALHSQRISSTHQHDKMLYHFPKAWQLRFSWRHDSWERKWVMTTPGGGGDWHGRTHAYDDCARCGTCAAAACPGGRPARVRYEASRSCTVWPQVMAPVIEGNTMDTGRRRLTLPKWHTVPGWTACMAQVLRSTIVTISAAPQERPTPRQIMLSYKT